MKLYSRGQARRSIFVTAGFRILSQLATLASYVVLVRGMTEQSFGILSLFYAVIPLISTVLSLGIEQTLRRYQPEYLQSAQTDAAAWLLRIAAFGRFATNLLVLGSILLLWQWLAPLFQIQPYRAEFTIFSVLILLHFQASILQLSLSSHMLQAYSVSMTVVLSVAKLLAYVVLIRFDSLTLMSAILADTLAYGLMYLGLRIAHALHCGASPAAGFRIEQAERTAPPSLQFVQQLQRRWDAAPDIKERHFFPCCANESRGRRRVRFLHTPQRDEHSDIAHMAVQQCDSTAIFRGSRQGGCDTNSTILHSVAQHDNGRATTHRRVRDGLPYRDRCSHLRR